LLAVLIGALGAEEYPELRKCWEGGNESCGLELAKQLVKDPKTEEEGMNIFLDLALRGNSWAPKYVARGYIYPKGPLMKKMRSCNKGIFFLFAGSKKDPETIHEMAKLFKRGVCVRKDEKKYQKYMKIYREALSKNPTEPEFHGIPPVDDKELYPEDFSTLSEGK